MASSDILSNADHVRQIIKSHFSSTRQPSQFSFDSSPITEDLRFLIRFVSDSVAHPVVVLRDMGIINLQRWIAINPTVLQPYLARQRNRISQTLETEEWKREDEALPRLTALIGADEVKNWNIWRYPTGVALERELMDNRRLAATPANLTPTDAGDTAEPPKMGYPLVSVHYEREFQRFVEAEIPSTRPPRRMQIWSGGSIVMQMSESAS
jgi:hypothetical protein